MKHYKEVERTEIVNKLVKTTCDICGKEFDPVIEKEGGITRYNEVVLPRVKGHEYNEYGEYYDGRKNLKLDICGDCFKEKIKPFLKSLGVSLQYTDSDGDEVDDPDEGD